MTTEAGLNRWQAPVINEDHKNGQVFDDEDEDKEDKEGQPAKDWKDDVEKEDLAASEE